ncbi:S46 family peptidase [Luteibacter aegosomatissinici]|uniref:S46 family peptidase n=1 Tax=Luteibacter aegosomatissinici TaxID=2911539 RepID=UPI001FF91BE5|nr:S46 family peptidase [Luteibacter aegosomatissinici]UPG93200.1 S46 family peptidase [Luteibacter aegosomatissinici]
MRIRTMMLGAAMALALEAKADEGMWMPSQLPSIAKNLKAAGFRGDAADLADLTKAPLNAVVRVGGGTGSFVSADGLLVTNHHVAFGVIQYNSKPDRDLITNGYVAPDRAGELPANPDYRARVTVGFDKVTERILASARGKTGRAYYDAVDAASKALVAECEKEAGIKCSVATMFYGRDFYLVKQLELRDIRLVYAPPRAIGNYGDETDNFMWPRHAGDFTILRAYVGPDGKPADYSPDNKPYHPPSHLQIATDGVAEGDFVMLAGYPGITYRHRTAAEFADQVEWRLPTSVAVLKALQDVIEEQGKSNKDAAIRYASQLQSLKNGIKRFSGELEGLERSDAVTVRREDEAAMLAWLARQPEANTLKPQIDQAMALIAQGKDVRERDLLVGLLSSQTQLMRGALNMDRLAVERPKADAERESGYQKRDEELIQSQLKQIQRRYDPKIEKALITSLLTRYQKLPAAQHLAEVDKVFGTTPAEVVSALDRIYGSTMLGDEAERNKLFTASPADVVKSTDALMLAARTLRPALLRIEDEKKSRDGDLLRLRPAYMQALIGYREKQGKAVYPDANSTLRVSYGKVTPLMARDAVTYAPLTTAQGIVEKNTGKVPFDAPQPLLDAIRKGDFAGYADPKTGAMPVDFLSNLDTTGGNSGSPVLNAKGELVGLNFDSNWEAVSASWMYDPRYKRAIHVDMRYMRWLMDKVYPSPALLKELGTPAH